MSTKYELIDNTDLTFDEVTIHRNENQEQIPENLMPTSAMQDRFMQNCVDMGILRIIN